MRLGPILLATIAFSGSALPTYAAAPLSSQATPLIGAAVLAKVDADVDADLRATHSEAATIAIIKNGRTVYTRGYGLRDLATALPADVQTRYEVGSLTKQFTAVAVLQLKEAGKVDLDARLSTYLPLAPHAESVTLRQLLTQTSGFKDYMSAPNIDTLVETPATFDQLMARITDEPLGFKPGTQWEYSSTNYLILGHVIEVVSGETWDDYLREHIFVSAGMKDSATIAQEGAVSDMARGYTYINGKNEPSVPLDESWAGAAGGIVSTVGDLTRWHEALTSGKIISLDDYSLLSTPARFPDGSYSEYGFGLYVDTYDGQPRVWHNGNTFGFDASDQFFPKQDMRIIVLTNSADGGSDEVVARIYNDLFPAIAAAALNGAAGSDPALAEKLDAHAQPLSTDMTPLDMYRRALATMHAAEAPPFLQFKVAANTTFKGTVWIQHFVHVERTSDRREKIRAVDVELHRNVHPLDVAPDLFLGHASATAPESGPNVFSVGLETGTAKSLSTIATVENRSHYKVTLSGREVLSGCGQAIHLKLEPLTAPMAYNLRDLWIDPATSRICKARAVWWSILDIMYPQKVVATVTLDLNADGLIEHYATSVSARQLLATETARQDASFSDIRSVNESVWTTAPVLDSSFRMPHS